MVERTTLHLPNNGYQRQLPRLSTEEVQRRYGVETVYRLSQNENPLGPSPAAIAAIHEATPTLSYYPNFSDIELRQALAQAIGRGLTPEHLYTGCSGFEALELLTRSILQPEDEVIVSTPTFISAYQKTTHLAGAKLVDVPLQPDTFAYDVAGVLAAINQRTKMILLCNPNNPTGTIITQAQMAQLMAHVPDHVLVVVDEVYNDFVDDPDYPDLLPSVLAGKNLVLLYSFSKAYGLAGLRLGYGIARPQLANHIASLHRGFHHSTLTLAAGVAAVRDQAHLRRCVDYLKEEVRWLACEFDRLGLRYWPPAANFILFETPLTAPNLTEKLMAYGVLVRPQHKSGLLHGVRVSAGTRPANEAFIRALGAILADDAQA